MTTALARSAPSPKPSMAGDGVTLPLADGETRVVRFSSRAIISIENVFDSHEDFLVEFDRLPMNTLAWVLINCCPDVPTSEVALNLLDGCNWREMKALVMTAWDKANPPPAPPDPTEGEAAAPPSLSKI